VGRQVRFAHFRQRDVSGVLRPLFPIIEWRVAVTQKRAVLIIRPALLIEFLARFFGFVKSSIAASVSVFAATCAPLWPIDVPEAATACQEWAGVPGTQVAVLRPTVGTV
jgi:hypothetical protein